MSTESFDVAIIGGGIVGLATARALAGASSASLVVLEAEQQLASHQTGHNSGVIHSGLYYKPGSSKARNCAAGRDALYEFCREYEIAHEQCGKIVVATRDEELPALAELERRGADNGLAGLRRLAAEEISDFEPHARGIGGLLVPQTGIVDYVEVARTFARLAEQQGAAIRTQSCVEGVQRTASEIALATTQGDALRCRYLVNCGGLQSDRVARMCGTQTALRIIPFRGEYYELVDDRQHLVRNLIYPVPDPRFPFLGVHFTRMIHGGIEAGPNAVLALARHGYRKSDLSPRDILETIGYGGFWRLALKYGRMGLGEAYRSLSKSAFVRELQRLIPELQSADVRPAGAGVRAQAVGPDGRLVDDFHIEQDERMIHVLNAPSPAATASISIGETISRMALDKFDLPAR